MPPEEGKVRIVRDGFGVPHIMARDSRSLYFGAGYAQAEDQLENVYKNYLRAQGRVSEQEGFMGALTDRVARMFRLSDRARDRYEELPPESRTQLEGFTDGVNYYIEQNRDEVPDWIEPVEPQHVLGFMLFIDTVFSIRNCQGDLAKAGIQLGWNGPLPGSDDEVFGSNQFAISPQRSSTGNALLSMDPHLPLSGFFRWYEMHLIGPETNVMGACLIGMPDVSMGRTERTAWCMTVNGPDLGDVFTFNINPDDPTQYQGIDGWENFQVNEVITKQGSGKRAREQKYEWKETTLGPVAAEKDGVAYVFALPLPTSLAGINQLHEMAKAQTLDEFRQSLEPLGLVMFNLAYADADGNIFYISNGRVPRRDTRIGSHDLRPGEEPWARWKGFHDSSELPQVANPPSGYVMNTNSGPQNVTPKVAPQPSNYPEYLMSQRANSRSRRLHTLLEGDRSLDWEEMHRYATDTRIEAADQQLPQFLANVESFEVQSEDDQSTLAEVSKVLSAWDRRTDLDSKGAVLFHALLNDKDLNKATEKGDSAGAAKAVLNVAAEVQETFGALDVPWGDFSRIKRGDVELGIAGSGNTGGAALRPSSGGTRKGRRYCNVGSSYGMIVDFSGKTQAISCLPFGVSENPDSPHFADQLPYYAKRDYKPAWFSPAEIEENKESELVLSSSND